MKIKYIKRISCLLLMLLVINHLSAQKETYNWAFGYGAGLTWNSTRSFTATGLNVPGSITLDGLPDNFGTSINTLEGCFTLSNKDGELLFYSDGTTIWNRNNAIMPAGGGLTGDDSSAQSGIIVPHPGKKDTYVAFTLGTLSDYLSYAVIDMSLYSGLGAVIKKNYRLTDYTGIVGESMTAIKHANGVDYWILAPSRGGPYCTMNAWLLTSAGISSVSVKSRIPFPVTTGANGYLKVRPDGKYFVWATFTSNTFIYGDFDTNTGMVSNPKQLTGYMSPYGVEFSSDNELVYLKCADFLYVYRMSDLINDINSPKKAVTSGANIHAAVQLSPDGRLYIPVYNTRNMLIVEDINDYDNFKVYELINFTAKNVGLGLPSFSGSWFSGEVADKSFVCRGNDFRYTMEISLSGHVGDHPVRLEWNWGDGSPIEQQNIVAGQTTYKLPHNYMAPGKYTIRITPYKAGNVALSPITVDANVVDCKLKVNRMVRVNLPNTAEKNINQ